MRVTLEEVEALIRNGDVVAARRKLDYIARAARKRARLAHDVAQLYMRLNKAREAARFYERAVRLDPRMPAYRYNYSTGLIATGRLAEAEETLDRVIAERPRDYDAWYNRATLRRQTPEHNHVASIERELGRGDLSRQESVPLYYALARELEDLGEWERSFAALERGASARRSMLSYRVEADEAIMDGIVRAFPASALRDPPAGCDDERPVFVVGLPRSGTTLVERILTSHSRIGSHGESSDFPLSLMARAGKVSNKDELLKRSVEIDPHVLGEDYGRRLALESGDRIVDKTPANFLYLGLIARALPHARIVYVRRGPMDVCYALYKTLFRVAYPYSYDLNDLARYWLAFAGMMRHWQAAVAGDQLLTVDYEHLVHAPEETARGLLAHVGMPWEDACLAFHRNPAPSLTASAGQVREPIYTSSVGLWRRYEAQLAPLARALEDRGVAINDKVAV